MNFGDVILWGFIATLLMTTIMMGSVAAGLSRMGMPFMLGTMFSADRNRAPLYGFFAHLANGWMFALVYAWAFEAWGRAEWWAGAIAGVLHGLIVLVVMLPILPGLHPRMASEHQGPEPTRALEPPGFMGLHYGRRTPIVALVAHAVYGAVLGGFYSPV